MREIAKNRHGFVRELRRRYGSMRIDGSIAKSTKTVSARIFVGELGAAICPERGHSGQVPWQNARLARRAAQVRVPRNCGGDVPIRLDVKLDGGNKP